MKRNAKDKAIKIKNHQLKTGGGNIINERLTSTQERILSLMGDIIFSGQPNSFESEVENLTSQTFLGPSTSHATEDIFVEPINELAADEIPSPFPVITEENHSTVFDTTDIVENLKDCSSNPTEQQLISNHSKYIGKKRKILSNVQLTETIKTSNRFLDIQEKTLELKVKERTAASLEIIAASLAMYLKTK